MSFGVYLAGVMGRDLDSLRAEIEAYPNDAALWVQVPGIPNAAGTLALHLAGNLQHLVGTVLGGTGYVRDRDAEFARRDVPRAELVAGLEAARIAVEHALGGLPDSALDHPFPMTVGGVQVTTGEFLVHLVSHLGYHIGQIDSHRRIVTGAARGVGAQSIPALRSARPVAGP